MIPMKNVKVIGVGAKNTRNKLAIPLSMGFDVASGTIVTGARGETIINGGLQQFTALVGSTNNYKTTISNHMCIKALEVIMESGYPSVIDTLDTEVSMEIERLESQAEHLAEWVRQPISRDVPIWNVSDTSVTTSNDWVMLFVNNCRELAKTKDIEFTCFVDPYTKKARLGKIPSITAVDSLTKLKNNKINDMLGGGDLDSSDTTTAFLREGMFKKKFLTILPVHAESANKYVVMTAHVSEKIEIASGPSMYIKPSKQLQFLKSGDAIKGTSEEFKQMTRIMFQAHTARLLNNSGNKKAEYPLSSNDPVEVDMNLINLTILRNKLGGSGYTIPIVVTQKEGVLPILSNFHYIKSVNRFGLEGSNVSYNTVFLPDIKLSRTTVRKKLDDNPLLASAVRLLADILQLHTFHYQYCVENNLIMTPEFIYEKIKGMGYDWELLLTARSYWLIDNYNPAADAPLSCADVLKMAAGTYHPFWYPKEGITNPFLNVAIDAK